MSEILDNEIRVKRKARPASIGDGSILASNTDRFVGHLVDMLCVFPLFLAYVFLMEYFLGELQDGEFFRQPIWLLVYVLLMFIIESVFSKTPGKVVKKTKVVNYAGVKPSTSSILIRNVCRMIPFDSFSFLGSDRGWHDTLSKTYVVYKD